MRDEDHLIQFLMGLNDGFDGLRNHLLEQDLLPQVGRACYLAFHIKQGYTCFSGAGVDASILLVAKSQESVRLKRDY